MQTEAVDAGHSAAQGYERFVQIPLFAVEAYERRQRPGGDLKGIAGFAGDFAVEVDFADVVETADSVVREACEEGVVMRVTGEGCIGEADTSYAGFITEHQGVEAAVAVVEGELETLEVVGLPGEARRGEAGVEKAVAADIHLERGGVGDVEARHYVRQQVAGVVQVHAGAAPGGGGLCLVLVFEERREFAFEGYVQKVAEQRLYVFFAFVGGVGEAGVQVDGVAAGSVAGLYGDVAEFFAAHFVLYAEVAHREVGVAVRHRGGEAGRYQALAAAVDAHCLQVGVAYAAAEVKALRCDVARTLQCNVKRRVAAD